MKIAVVLATVLLTGCSAMMPVHFDKMTPDQIKEYAKIKDASVMCLIANTPYGQARALYVNVDKGIVPNGTVTVDDQCKATITNATPAAPPK